MTTAHLFQSSSDPDPESADAKTVPTDFAQVAPERALDKSSEGLTYAVPESLHDIQVGERVLVPLGRGNKPTPAFVIDRGIEPTIDVKKIKPILSRDPKAGGSLTPDLVLLGQWIASYYCSPLGMTLTSMLPAAVKHGTGVKRTAYLELAPNTENIKLTTLQRRIVEVLRDESNGQPVALRSLATQAGAKTVTPINRLIDAGVLVRTYKHQVDATWQDSALLERTTDRKVDLTDEQQTVVNDIAGTLGEGYSAHAIYGVTGSGKTEVYLRLIEQVVRSGKCAIVLVPEIALTPQTVTRFKLRFEALMHQANAGNKDDLDWNVAVLHSGLTNAQRHHQWQCIRKGEAQIAIGARSAIFAPFPADSVGIIVVDEEHDHSYKQDQSPRYHARDVAVRRAHLLNATVVLGSATPSLETYANAVVRRNYTWHEILERVPGSTLPKVQITDLIEERKRRPRTDRHVHLLGPRLEESLRGTLAQGGDAILLLNRRGYANYISCPDQNCGWVMTCDHCDVAMVYHKNHDLPKGGFVRCHHCQAEQLLPTQCPLCSKTVVTFGLGTQRIEEEITRKFPEIAEAGGVLRMDSDTMNNARDYETALEQFRVGEARILVGTQMIAKGLDFPNVRLVGVINADTAINLPDFRASERTYQLVAQVSGRSGRGAHAGRVVVQTFSPHHPAIQFAARHDYHGFAEQELQDRLPAGLPPIGRMARIVVRHTDHIKCAQRAQRLYDALDRHLQQNMTTFAKRAGQTGFDLPADIPPVRLRGPAPCPLSRIADHHRWSMEILSAVGPGPVQQLLTLLRNEGNATSDSQTAIDVDPVSLL